ncbi:hypothetical protein DSO57_1033888 [Entomophthora muscae]|uniref:Uncharacterized protein n=1 Tax=Entomophthora muscae TaxID=34485 RepID=A0ACC2RR16_9FUNG|nr:hypothetical protein DSO57_1033888 [Entomophthora muscae]
MSLPANKSNAPWAQSRNCIIFSLISIIQGILVITVEAVIYTIISSIRGASIHERETNELLSSLLIYLLIFMGSQIFQVIISIESVFFKNTLQIFGVIAFNIMALVYSVFQCYQIETAKKFGAREFEDKKKSHLYPCRDSFWNDHTGSDPPFDIWVSPLQRVWLEYLFKAWL